ncbi:MAG TPA: alpha/beta fold hydrolase [Myxococcus sp.]|nr:alpha/beta fold hydrolase [Myxococcus sp.]
MSSRRWLIGLLVAVPLLFGARVALAGKPGGGGTTTRNPIIFVHGYQGSGSQWNTMISRFKADGWTAEQLFAFNYNSGQCVETSAAQLRTYINDVLARTGAAKVDIIAHSLGGLVADAAGGSVAQSVALGSPFKGTDTANVCFDCACQTMRPPGPGGCLSATWWSPCDEIINPDTSASCGQSHQTACLGHMDLMTDLTVYQGVRDYVKPL